jgi:hypothetical protein
MIEDKAKTDDSGKDPLAWLPWGGLRAVSAAQVYGQKKYGDFNNYRKGLEVTRNLSCAQRHIRAYLEGKDIDPESGVHHLGEAAVRVLFVLQNIYDGVEIDDRYKKPLTPAIPPNQAGSNIPVTPPTSLSNH